MRTPLVLLSSFVVLALGVAGAAAQERPAAAPAVAAAVRSALPGAARVG